MIVAATDNNINEIKSFCKGSMLGTRIICLCECYGFSYDFFKVYLLYDDSDVLSGVFSSFYGSITVIGNEQTEIDEIFTFLNFAGYSSITVDCALIEGVEPGSYETKNVYRFSNSSEYETAETAEEADYKKAYTLISESIPGSFANTKDAYFSWLSDFTFRKHRGFARMKCVKLNGELVSCAMTAAECEYSAIISGVACVSVKRKSGAGKSVVLTLSNELKNENKDVYVIALNSSAEGFYEHIGFEKCGTVAILER